MVAEEEQGQALGDDDTVPFRCQTKPALSTRDGRVSMAGPIPSSLTSDVHGNILVTDEGTSRLQVFSSKGELLCTRGTRSAQRPWLLAWWKTAPVRGLAWGTGPRRAASWRW